MGKVLAEIKLKDGRIAKAAFLSKKDGAKELMSFINAIIEEDTYLHFDKKVTLKQEEEWKGTELKKFRENEGYVLIARVDGKIVGSSGASREAGKGRGNVVIGISIAKPFRRLGLGERLFELNIKTAKERLKPRNIYLWVMGPNKPARALYKKLGFKEMAVFPKWMLHKGRYIDQIFMKL